MFILDYGICCVSVCSAVSFEIAILYLYMGLYFMWVHLKIQNNEKTIIFKATSVENIKIIELLTMSQRLVSMIVPVDLAYVAFNIIIVFYFVFCSCLTSSLCSSARIANSW